MRVLVFVKPDCPKCPAAKKLAEKIGAEVHDVSTPNGLAEATYYDILSTPSFLVIDEHGEVIASWHGEVPKEEEIRRVLENKRVH